MKCSTCKKHFSPKFEKFINPKTKEQFVLKSETCSYYCNTMLEKRIGIKTVLVKL